MPKKAVIVSSQLDAEIVARLDAFCLQVNRSRSNVVRGLLLALFAPDNRRLLDTLAAEVDQLPLISLPDRVKDRAVEHERAMAVLVAHPNLSTRDMVFELEQRGIKRGRDWVLIHRRELRQAEMASRRPGNFQMRRRRLTDHKPTPT